MWLNNYGVLFVISIVEIIDNGRFNKFLYPLHRNSAQFNSVYFINWKDLENLDIQITKIATIKYW